MEKDLSGCWDGGLCTTGTLVRLLWTFTIRIDMSGSAFYWHYL